MAEANWATCSGTQISARVATRLYTAAVPWGSGPPSMMVTGREANAARHKVGPRDAWSVSVEPSVADSAFLRTSLSQVVQTSCWSSGLEPVGSSFARTKLLTESTHSMFCCWTIPTWSSPSPSGFFSCS